jgi:hypothetical protein
MSWGGSWFSSGSTATDPNLGFLPECETPQTLSQYKEIARSCLQNIVQYEKESEPNGGFTSRFPVKISKKDFLAADSELEVEELEGNPSFGSTRWVPIGDGWMYEGNNYNKQDAIQMMEKADVGGGLSCIKTVGYMPVPPRVRNFIYKNHPNICIIVYVGPIMEP